MIATSQEQWWIYTPQSWPEPAHGPYASHTEAWTAAGWLCGVEEFSIDHRPPWQERDPDAPHRPDAIDWMRDGDTRHYHDD